MSSGLVVLTEWMPDSPTVAVVLSTLAGARREPHGRDGLATLTADVLIEGTRTRTGDELAWAIDSAGGSMDVLTGYEAARLVSIGLADTAADLVSLTAEVAYAPALEPGAVERSRRRLLGEIAEEQDDPYAVAQRALFRQTFGEHPRGRAGIGTAEGVSAVTVADVRAFHAKRYRPDTSVLAIAGRFDRKAVLDAANGIAGRGAAEPDGRVPDPPVPAPSTELVQREGEQVHIALGCPGIRRTDPLYLPASVLDVIFGDSAGFSSRLATRLREGDGLAYMVEGDIVGTSGVDPGLVWIYTATAPDRASAALDAIVSEIRSAVSDAPSADELESAVAFLKGRRVLGRETAEARAASLIRMERYALGFDYDERYPDLLDAVTAEDVLSAARRFLNAAACSIVAVGPLDAPLPLPCP
jgi:zinc protease